MTNEKRKSTLKILPHCYPVFFGSVQVESKAIK